MEKYIPGKNLFYFMNGDKTGDFFKLYIGLLSYHLTSADGPAFQSGFNGACYLRHGHHEGGPTVLSRNFKTQL